MATLIKGFGDHPLGLWGDNTQEMLAVALRSGSAGSSTAADHTIVLTAAVAQVPPSYRTKMLVPGSSSGAGSSWVGCRCILMVSGWPAQEDFGVAID